MKNISPKLKRILKTLLVELRRIFSLLLIPWIGATFLCVLASWYLISVVGLDALIAPVLKAWTFVKAFWAKFSSWFIEIFAVVLGVFGGLKAWSFKKLLRQSLRFVVSFAARFFLISVFLNFLFGDERKGVKQVPTMLVTRFKNSRYSAILLFWHKISERQKRLFLGVVLCLVLVFAGHAFLGLSILLFDIVWELILILARFIARFWRFMWPIVARFIPNAIGNFFTNKVLPMFADAVPIIKDDQRVMYLRFNIRTHFRNIKAALYRKSRSKRYDVRGSLRPYVSASVRDRKKELLEAAKRSSKKPDS